MANQSSHYPNVTKCFLCIDLKLGVLAYLSFELMVWAFLSFMAIDNESSFFHNYDLYKFEEHIEDNWYYQMMFGQPEEEDYDYEEGFESALDDSDGIDIEYRYQNITVNGILMMIFVAYFLLCFIFILGIAKKNTNLAIPYLLFDLFLIWMSFICVIGGLFMVNLILIRNCSIFTSVKLYPAICNFSLFKKMGGKFEFTRTAAASNPASFKADRRDVKNGFELKSLHTDV